MRNCVPSTVPAIPATTRLAWRRAAAPSPGFRTAWIVSITMFGSSSTTTAVRTSVARARRGVATVGKPKPIAPLTKAATRSPPRPSPQTAGITEWSAGDGLPEQLGRVLRLAARGVGDLLAARDAGRAHRDFGRQRLHRRDEPAVRDLERQVVVLRLEAERARHPAAAGIHLAHLVAGALQHGDRRGGADLRLLVAV